MPDSVRRDPITLYVDFASPYAYFILEPLVRLAKQHDRKLAIKPFLVWAVLKHHGVSNPIEKAARRDYFMADVLRSADFFGVPYRMPEPLQISAHLAARLFHAVTMRHPDRAMQLAREIFAAQFVHGAEITNAAVLASLPGVSDLPAGDVWEMVDGQVGRQRLAATIDEAIAAGVIGSPFVVIDGEGFFGADRLPQIAWRLGTAKAKIT